MLAARMENAMANSASWALDVARQCFEHPLMRTLAMSVV